ncbi:TIM barrel protein [Arthrobacter sp. APC 3897]|uniref:bifunctional sugar phosphate isomerase/epimerase/4-hydroxyphenylpyruvate dioxygenase family protein n=1 Tax=Arthrobacter sp. APC 3897 TaxID=3035204 RepID=UPI0025B31588|nr:sugar phosphate isomerase/epimerase and 4-hydroxyphenylpyruvate domain-containing protein [Arthrobacter sp. APC 3897]MDN3480382.1 TIM barrel protein [Arthrobacter sp. APC 3897]
MRTSIATVCLSGTLEEKMRACAAAGFDGIEIFEQDLIVSPDSPEEIRDLAAELGLSLDLFQPFRDFEGVTEELLRENLYRAEAKFRVMNRLGIDTMLVCSNVATATVDDDGVAASQLRRMGSAAARYGIRLAYEALAWGKYVNDFEHAQRIVDLADHPNVGTCLDSFHILSRGANPAGIEKIPAEKIFFVQLADAPELSLDVLSWSRHYRVFPGEGAFDLTTFMAHLVRSGYNGPVSLEVFNDVFRQTAEERTAVDARRSLMWLEERTSVSLAEDGEVRAYPMDLATLPVVAEPTGFNFAEVKAEDTGAVEKLLFQLGLHCEGRHRTKPVQLWSAGRARVIINQQQARGMPAISALGLDVQDPQAAASRAVQLKAQPVSRRSQADEAVLQAVSAPDSTEIFLCEATEDGTVAWADEFAVPPRPAGGQGGHGPGVGDEPLITHIDHINLSQPWQHFDEAVLFYESTLSLLPRASQEVPSPMGLVRSQVMRSSDGAVRLALNIAPMVLEQQPGRHGSAEYPQHVAFACRDVVALARRARERGLDFLPVPANYYEDLQARFRLEDDLLALLQSLNLLYDRDGDGEFLHFYTATVGSVFFEVVERRGRYDGYGAPNAPVRLASQYQREGAGRRDGRHGV